MRVLQFDSVSDVGLVIDTDNTNLSEFQFLLLEREWETLCNNTVNNKSGSKQQHDSTNNTTKTLMMYSTSSLQFHQVSTEQIGYQLESIPVNDILDKTFGGIELTRDFFGKGGILPGPFFTSSSPHQQQHESSQLHQKNSSSSSSNNINFHQFLFLLFPAMPSMSIHRFFYTYLPEDILLELKGSVGIPPFVRFSAKSKPSTIGDIAAATHARITNNALNNTTNSNENPTSGNRSSSASKKSSKRGKSANTSRRSSPARRRRGSDNNNSSNTNNSNKSDTRRLQLNGPSFDEMTGAVGARLDLKLLSNSKYTISNCSFTQENFEAVTSRFAPHGTSPLDWRASFFECLAILFPRIPEALLRCYEITTPTSISMLNPFRELFIVKNPSAVKSQVQNTITANNEKDDNKSKKNDSKQQQSEGRFSSSALSSMSPKTNTSKQDKNKKTPKTSGGDADNNNSSANSLFEQVMINSALPSQFLPSNTIQTVNLNAVPSIQDLVSQNLFHQEPQQQNSIGESNNNTTTTSDNSNNFLPQFPASKQILSLSDYKEICFNTKQYSELVPGVRLSYHIFLAIERSFPPLPLPGSSSSSATGSSSALNKKNTTKRKRNAAAIAAAAAGNRISLASTLRFYFPNAPLPLFLLYIDQLERCSESNSKLPSPSEKVTQQLLTSTTTQQQQSASSPTTSISSPAGRKTTTNFISTETDVFQIGGKLLPLSPSPLSTNRAGRVTGTVIASQSQQQQQNITTTSSSNLSPQSKSQQQHQAQQHQQQKLPSLFEMQNTLLLKDPSAVSCEHQQQEELKRIEYQIQKQKQLDQQSLEQEEKLRNDDEKNKFFGSSTRTRSSRRSSSVNSRNRRGNVGVSRSSGRNSSSARRRSTLRMSSTNLSSPNNNNKVNLEDQTESTTELNQQEQKPTTSLEDLMAMSLAGSTSIKNVSPPSPSSSPQQNQQQQQQQRPRGESRSNTSSRSRRRSVISPSPTSLTNNTINSPTSNASTTHRLIRLTNGIYTSRDLSQEIAILDVREKSIALEKEKKAQRKAERTRKRGGGRSSSASASNKRSSSKGRNKSDEESSSTLNTDNVFSQQQQRILNPLHHPDIDSADDDSEYFDTDSDNNDYDVNNRPKTNLHDHRPVVGESVSSSVLHQYYEYLHVVENEKEVDVAMKLKQQKEFEQELSKQIQLLKAEQSERERNRLEAIENSHHNVGSGHNISNTSNNKSVRGHPNSSSINNKNNRRFSPSSSSRSRSASPPTSHRNRGGGNNSSINNKKHETSMRMKNISNNNNPHEIEQFNQQEIEELKEQMISKFLLQQKTMFSSSSSSCYANNKKPTANGMSKQVEGLICGVVGDNAALVVKEALKEQVARAESKINENQNQNTTTATSSGNSPSNSSSRTPRKPASPQSARRARR